MGEKVSLHLSVQGEFVTALAREKCYKDGKFDYAMELLTSCLVTDQLTEREIRHIAIDILNGEAEIVGTYPGDDYGLNYLEKKDNRWNLGKLIQDLSFKCRELEAENTEMSRKLAFLSEDLSDYRKKELNIKYAEVWDEVLFSDVDDVPSALDSYLKRMLDTGKHTTADYGWLAPSGEFHEVPWGDHQKWAYEYLEKHAPKDFEDIQYELYNAGDKLIKVGWVLLHNPSQGIAFPTKSETRRYTFSQKNFLYDYYMERGCEREANAIFSEEDE